MKKEEIQRLVSDTEKELKDAVKEKEATKIKAIVKRLLKKKDDLLEEKADVDKKIKYVKMDLDDLKDGRLDRIEERQKKDPDAKKNAVVIIIKEKVIREREVPVSPYYQPYRFIWATEVPDSVTTINAGSAGWITTSANSFSGSSTPASYVLTCSTVKNNVLGTYDVDGHIVHLR